MTTQPPQPQSPFAGLRVIELAHTLAGPYAGLILADLGCDVIKVEPPETGDASRRSLGPRQEWGESTAFLAVNRNKRSVVLDLKTPEGLELLRALARTADVLVESYRPGTAKRLGVDYETLRELNPRLVYASVSGFGSTGPYAERGGYDIIAQGMSGIMSVTGAVDGEPAKAGVPLTDIGAGLFAAVGILAALAMREQTGTGQWVQSSLFEAGIAYAVWEATELWTTGEVPGRLGSAHRMAAPYQALRTGDGYITIGANNDRLWKATAEVLGHPEWTGDPRFETVGARLAHRRELIDLIETVTRTRAATDLLDALERAGVPTGAVNDYEQVFSDPQALARGMVMETDHPQAGRIKMIGPAWKMSELPMGVRRPPPRLGEHTAEVLNELGVKR